MTECICEGNWRTIVKEVEHLIDKTFKNELNDKDYVFYGVVWGFDDFYYGMYNEGDARLLSCVGSIEAHGYYLK